MDPQPGPSASSEKGEAVLTEIVIQLGKSLHQRETAHPELAAAVTILDAHAPEAAELAASLINAYLRNPGGIKKALQRRYRDEMGYINLLRAAAWQPRLKGVSASDLSLIVDIVFTLGDALHRVYLGLPLLPHHPHPGDGGGRFFSELRSRLMTELEAASKGQFPAYKAVSSHGGL